MSQRVFRSTDGYEPVDLLKYARGHLHAAEVLFPKDHHSLDSAAHLSHLAIELLLKAALLEAQGTFPGEHDLNALLVELANAGRALSITQRNAETVALLDSFQECRYPNPREPIEVGTEDLPAIQQLWDDLLEQLSAPLRTSFLEADQLTKGSRILMVKRDA